ncbi:MAG TPA: TIGR00266 family protein [Anaerolineae bacterium]|nr:TIGR00266 family protein [Anaerolineae bacterium]HQK15533.1 TIGR00266 family protein [Anaerolineae bacterium]
MKSHEIDYKIFGDDLQFVEIELDRGETVIAEAGAMVYMENGIAFESKMGDGSKPSSGFFDKVLDVGKRVITGESLFMTHFTNVYEGKRHVAFGAPYPGKIIPIDLDEVGGELLCQKDSFLCAALGTEISIAFNKKIGVGLFGGEGFILQRLRGDGMVFIHAGGTIVEKRLENDKILIDTGCIVAFESQISYNIERAGNLKSMIFGGEGLFLATLQGTGRVWIQSLPFSRLADRILQTAPQTGGKSTDEGSVVRGLTKLMGS